MNQDAAATSQMKKAFNLFEILANRDILTAQHSLNVACLTKTLAANFIKTELGKEKAFIAGLLHDIGKVKMPDFVFSNYVIDTQEEKEVIQQHPAYSKAILENMGFDADIVKASYQHHERFDGSGYPSGLKEFQITPAARLLSIVDSFSAILEDRPYRKGANVKNAVDILLQEKELFDVQMLSTFFKHINHIVSLSGIEVERYKNSSFLSNVGLAKAQIINIGGIL